MELQMPGTKKSQLVMFNTLTLQLQDEAFTLAYYLLGDEARAAEATQVAFSGLYQRPGLKLESFRRDVLRRVILQCRGAQGAISGLGFNSRDEISIHLMKLDARERCVAVLVDVLGLSYTEASDILGCPRKEVGKLLAHARLNLAQPVL